jgi:hypothetical protein
VKLGELAAIAAADAIRPPSVGRRPGRPVATFTPATEVQLPDGTVGYCLRRQDDCLVAALATLLQIDYDELPDTNIDERLALGQPPEDVQEAAAGLLERWLAWRGLKLELHTELPPPADRWIGIVPVPGWFQSHALVMAGDQILFDPQHARDKAFVHAAGFAGVAPARVFRRSYACEISHGYTIERITD